MNTLKFLTFIVGCLFKSSQSVTKYFENLYVRLLTKQIEMINQGEYSE